jgi:multidrug transporter EmrE-like cation transporter
MKTGANQMANADLLTMARNLPLMAGYSLYGLSTVLLVLALRDGELSILYPIIALTYVWVTFLSYTIFHDAVNPWRLLGVTLIVTGVAILGRSGAR